MVCQVQDLLVVDLFDEFLVIKFFILQPAIMTDKLDTLSLEIEVTLVSGHICDLHGVVLLGSLDGRVGWSTVRAVSMI